MKSFQKEIILKSRGRGFHLVTDEIIQSINTDLAGVDIGICHLFILHTSASLTINENADPDVRTDMEMAISEIVPESLPYVHTAEGSDDMPAHVKASFFGSSLSIPITRGRLHLGTWQGIYLGEHRNQSGSRRVLATILKG